MQKFFIHVFGLIAVLLGFIYFLLPAFAQGHPHRPWPRPSREVVLYDVRVIPRPGGFVPGHFAYRINARVMRGTNPCDAANSMVSFVQQRQYRRLEVKAIKTLIDPHRFCTMEYRPQYEWISTTVRGYSEQIWDTFIENVEVMGRNISLARLL